MVFTFFQVGLMHLTRLKLGTVKKFLSFVQDALPTQLRAVHVLNATYIFEKLLVIFKPFMRKELFEMVSITQTYLLN